MEGGLRANVRESLRSKGGGLLTQGEKLENQRTEEGKVRESVGWPEGLRNSAPGRFVKLQESNTNEDRYMMVQKFTEKEHGEKGGSSRHQTKTAV